MFRDTKDEGISRGVAIQDQLIAVLRSVICDRTEGTVFLTDDVVPYKTVPKTARVELVVGQGSRIFTSHDLRHTFATYALVAGVPIRIIKEQMGHARAEDMQSQYVHFPAGT